MHAAFGGRDTVNIEENEHICSHVNVLSSDANTASLNMIPLQHNSVSVHIIPEV